MATKKQDSTQALVTVVKALEELAEADRTWVLQSAAARWNLAAPANSSLSASTRTGASSGNSLAPKSVDVQQSIDRRDARAFIRAKRPTTDVQRVACLGYFSIQTTGQPGFSSKEIAQANIDAGGTKMNLTRALDNATRRARYLSSRGGNSKQLTTLGEDVVDALPDQQAVSELEAAAKVRGKGKAKRSPKKKKA